MPKVYLEIVRGTDTGKRFTLVDGANSIGRDSSNDIALPPQERSVSGHHAILYNSSENLKIQDLQSTNGLYVDDNRVSECVLKQGSIIGFGKKGPRLALISSAAESDNTPHGEGAGLTDLFENVFGTKNKTNADSVSTGSNQNPNKGNASFAEDAPLSNASFQQKCNLDADQPLSNALFQGGSSFADDRPLSNASIQQQNNPDGDKPLSNALFQGGSSFADDRPLSNASIQQQNNPDGDKPLSNASFQGVSSFADDMPLSNASFQQQSNPDGDKPLSNASFQGGSSFADDRPLSNASFQQQSNPDGDKPLSNASFQGGGSFADDRPLSNASFQKESSSGHDADKPKSSSIESFSYTHDLSAAQMRPAGVGDIKIIDPESGLSGDMAPPSSTMAMEQKFIEKNIDADDIHDLMKNNGRLNRLVDRGKLGQTQANMLLSVQSASKRMRGQWVVLLCSVIGIAFVVIAFFAVRAFQYKKMVDKGLTLEKKLDTYEKQIFQVNNNPDANQEKLSKLLEEFEQTQTELKQVKTELRDDDYIKFYDDPLEQKIDGIMQRFGESSYHIPPQMVERVRYHIDIYSGRMKGTIGRYLKRKEKYFPMIKRIFKKKNLPLELAYVSMLESGFNPRALSHAGARGLWQFMPHTGRAYGLRVTDVVDDRLDPEKATYAAAEYFRDLIAIFGGRRSVMLAMAAYNAGEGRVMGALKKIDDPMRDRDFWYIYRMGYLAEETNEYIPRIIAMMIIDENAQEYGFGDLPVQVKTADLENEKDFMEVDFGESPFGADN